MLSCLMIRILEITYEITRPTMKLALLDDIKIDALEGRMLQIEREQKILINICMKRRANIFEHSR